MNLFTKELIRDFIDKAVDMTSDPQGRHSSVNADLGTMDQLIADMCNEVIKHFKTEGVALSQRQAEIIRDELVPLYVPLVINQAMTDKMRTLPVYTDQLLMDAHEIRHVNTRVTDIELVLSDITGLKAEVNLNAFTKTDIDPSTKIVAIAVNPIKFQQYQHEMVKTLLEIPVLVNGERVVN
jgi:hypothetical protein